MGLDLNSINIKMIEEPTLWETWPAMLADAELEIEPQVHSAVNAIYKYLVEGYTYQINYSSGKDSQTILGLFLLALLRCKLEGVKVSDHHFLVHVDTGIENPEIKHLASKNIGLLRDFIAKHNLPLACHIASPSLSSTWPSRVIGGRGLPTFVSSKFRQCTHELKISSANRTVSKHKKSMPKKMAKKIVMLLGSRDDEGTIRKNNIAKQGGSETVLAENNGKFTLYPIKSWTSSNVWEFLTYSGSHRSAVIPSYLDNNYDIIDLYRDSGAGECVVFQVDDHDSGAGSKSCGSRHGCFLCLAAGDDKSMLALIETAPEKYDYMVGLNRVQRYLEKTRYDWSLRHPVGRTINDEGFIKIQPDVYSPAMLKKVLHALISFDYLELKRANGLETKINDGTLEATEYNVRMSKPQFKNIDERQLVAIEFIWGLHQFQNKPFEALEIWHQVYTFNNLELLEEVDTMPTAPKTPQPKPFWVQVGTWDNGSHLNGLSDPMADMSYFDSDNSVSNKKIKVKLGDKKVDRRVIDYVEADLFDVDPEAAEFIVWEDYPAMRDKMQAGFHTPYYSTSHLLRFGAVQLGKGQGNRYHTMAQRGQSYRELGLTGQLSMEDIANKEEIKHLIFTNDELQELRSNKKEKEHSEKIDRIAKSIRNAEMEAKIKEEQAQKEEHLIKQQKAWAKSNPKAASKARKLKKELLVQHELHNTVQSLMYMTIASHAEQQLFILNGDVTQAESVDRLKNGYIKELAGIRKKQTKSFLRRGYRFLHNLNKDMLNDLDNDRVDASTGFHIDCYAVAAPNQFRSELKLAIAYSESMINSINSRKPIKKRVVKQNCPNVISKNIKVKVTPKQEQMSMDFNVFLASS